MQWLCSVLTSSIGKKIQVALAGLFLSFFLVSHLAGNLLLWAGPRMFNAYAEALEHNVLLPVAEIGLVGIFLLHVAVALRVRYENRQARPIGYQVSAWAGGRTVGSASMIVTGLLILAFVVVHVRTMKFADHGGNLHAFVVNKFKSLPYAAFYLAALLGLGLHLGHGVQAAARTFGIDHPKFTPGIVLAGRAFAAAIAGGFAALVVWAGWLAGVPQ